MTPQTRRERERAERHRLIIDTARELAESQGWDAVTVRRLAERIEYSQPVLYSHFAGKDEIVTAVAEEGIAEMAAWSRAALESAGGEPRAALAAVARSYLEFATARPALYDAMFLMKVNLAFGENASQPLRDAFAVMFAAFSPFAGEHDPETFTEVGWSALHGLATLDRGGRLRPAQRDARLAVLIDQWTR
ncbi:TetR/AcrR family transcriptional regulator [Nocardia asiatica]|uniref:TetR/AcrR family transcriptional regulator n=1 Tax=Nocardia asiatica TaxID=209252 RepID=UPI003EE0E6CB